MASGKIVFITYYFSKLYVFRHRTAKHPNFEACFSNVKRLKQSFCREKRRAEY